MPPPAVGHYRPNNLSNPYNNYPQPHNSHHNNHFQSQNTFQNLGGPQAFSNAQPNGHLNNIFATGLTNGGLTNTFGGSGTLGRADPSGLGGAEAQLRFHNPSVQSQHGSDALNVAAGSGMTARIREVWKNNLHQEMNMIRSLVDKYPYVSMDTEFPGVVARPMGNFTTKADYHYQTLRCNVDLLKLIQLGLTLFSPEGDLPPDTLDRNAYNNHLMPVPCTWTFNFQFSVEDDMYSEESINMLRKAGVDFQKTASMGIDPQEFGSILITSGLVLNEDVSWLSFHSGYDFGYLMKTMAQTELPRDNEEYSKLVTTFFPNVYDMKYLLKHAQSAVRRGVMTSAGTALIENLGTKSGLQDLANELGCGRTGRQHTAGSDAWLTGLVFFELRKKLFDGDIPNDLIGMIWGLNNVGQPASAASHAAAAAMVGHQTPNTNGATLYHTGMSPSAARPDSQNPQTPQSTHPGLASTTPGAHSGGHAFGGAGGMSGLTGGGVFSNFQPPSRCVSSCSMVSSIHHGARAARPTDLSLKPKRRSYSDSPKTGANQHLVPAIERMNASQSPVTPMTTSGRRSASSQSSQKRKRLGQSRLRSIPKAFQRLSKLRPNPYGSPLQNPGISGVDFHSAVRQNPALVACGDQQYPATTSYHNEAHPYPSTFNNTPFLGQYDLLGAHLGHNPRPFVPVGGQSSSLDAYHMNQPIPPVYPHRQTQQRGYTGPCSYPTYPATWSYPRREPRPAFPPGLACNQHNNSGNSMQANRILNFEQHPAMPSRFFVRHPKHHGQGTVPAFAEVCYYGQQQSNNTGSLRGVVNDIPNRGPEDFVDEYSRYAHGHSKSENGSAVPTRPSLAVEECPPLVSNVRRRHNHKGEGREAERQASRV